MQNLGDSSDTLLVSGDTVDRFEVEELLGQGGIAQVYKVRHRRLGSLHALKLLTIDRKGLAERLILEGQIQAQLRHPNVVAVTDVVEHLGRTGLLMEYVAGKSLEHWLVSDGVPPVERGLKLVAQVLSGVAAAHAAGVLHRDLKPANILLSETPLGVVPKVTDFGIAKLFAGADGGTGATRQGSAMGTPGYMAPEQIEDSAGVDARADVFALGAITYELIDGNPALRRQSLLDTFAATARGDFRPLEPSDALPESVAAAIHRALSPAADDRQSTVRELAWELFSHHPDLRAVVLGTPSDAAESIRTDGSAVNPTLVRKPTNPPTRDTWESEETEPLRRPAPAGAGNLAQRPPTLLPDAGPSSVEPATGAGPEPEEPPPGASWGGKAKLGIAAAVLLGLGAGVWALSTGDGDPGRPDVAVAPPTPAATQPTPDPAAEPPSQDVTPDAAPAPEPAAAADPAPVAEPEPEPTPVTPDLRGTWDGRWAGRPLRLVVKGQQGERLVGEIEISVGSTYRTFTVSGTIDPASGAVRFWESGGTELVLSGTLSGQSMSGTLTRKGQRKPQPWSATLTRGVR